MAQRTCTVDGCDKPHRARGYCSGHYNAILKPDRHRTVITCAECGKRHETTRTDGKYCSLDCRDAESRRRKALVGPVPRARTASPPRPAPPRPAPASARVWIAGPCAWCASPFIGRMYGTVDRYCTPTCGRRASDKRHATTGRNTRYTKWISAQRRYAIYARDLWECQLCGESVDRSLHYNDDWAASLDHIVERAKGGGDSPENLRLVHRWCNATRAEGERVGLFSA